MLVVVAVDLVTSAVALRASSIVPISVATNIFFISKPIFLAISIEHLIA